MEITKKQVLEIVMWGNSNDRLKIKKWFPEAFKVELEVGMIIKRINRDTEWIVKVCENYRLYGINTNGNYFDSIKDKETIELILSNQQNTEATTEEWQSALIQEAKKRGYKNGNYECLYMPGCTEEVSNDFFIENQELWIGDLHTGNMIFNNGVWAEIIKTFSKEEAEKLLGGRII